MSATFKPGQTVFDRSGHKYEFAEVLSGERALCRQIFVADTYDGGTEEYPADDPTIIHLANLAAKPPVAALSAEVAAKRAELEGIKERASEAMRHVAEQELAAAQRLAAIKDYSGLARLEDFIAGRITHFVLTKNHGISAEVKTLEEFLTYRNAYGREEGLKLLSLFGGSNGNLQWRVNHYSDGSGSYTDAEPATSFDEALARATEIVEAEWAAWRAEPVNYRWLANTILAAEKLGLVVPDDVTAARKAEIEKSARAAIEKAEADLAKATALLFETGPVAKPCAQGDVR